MATFDWLPILQGKYMTYYQIGSLIFSLICLLFAFIAFLIYLLSSKIIHQHLVSSRRGASPLILRSTHEGAYVSMFLWLGGIPIVCQALGVLGLVEGVVGTLAVYVLGLWLKRGFAERKSSTIEQVHMVRNATQNQQEQRNQQYQQLINSSSNQSPTYIIQNNPHSSYTFLRRCVSAPFPKKTIIYAFILALFLNLFFYKTCISFYNDQIGYTSAIFGPALNTYWSRYLQMRQSCPPGPPCHAYATIPQDPTTAFFFNVHTHAGINGSVTVYYQELDTSKPDEWQTVVAESYSYDELEWMVSRKIHSALISNLTPNTQYLLKVHYQSQFHLNSIYKTLPSDPSVPITMVNGGDSGYTLASHNLSKLISSYQVKPDIIFIGGDVAYDNNIAACGYTWDYFLWMIERISNQVGYVIPLGLALGNHDAGLNQLSGINITTTDTAFFKYFPQQFKRDSAGKVVAGVPSVKDRRSFVNFRWGEVSYTMLDSGYLHGFDGFQKQFMRQTFEKDRKEKRIKFVNYHVPIYSACQRFDKNPERFLYALFHWIPLFDEFSVMTAFENHVHSFKRTKPLKSSQPAENGTVYVGDGAYGAVLTFVCKPDATMNIFDVHGAKNNVWISVIDGGKGEVRHVALDPKGNKIDEFVQMTSAYK